MKSQLQEYLEKRVQQCVGNIRISAPKCPKIEIKKEGLTKRNGEIVRAKAIGQIASKEDEGEISRVVYEAHWQYLINQKGQFYIEEEIEQRQAEFFKGVLVEDKEMDPYPLKQSEDIKEEEVECHDEEERNIYQYNRLRAVQYAERWWNDYNPQYHQFEVDCTNYISQCINAGGAPMIGYPNRSRGWWMRSSNWSYSWTVANSLRWYLPGSKAGLRAKEVNGPEELDLGDVICYDFQGDGRFDHTTIVTGKDYYGMPLVNAHTTNSRKRYWAYEDSTAYTPNIKYKFFHIVDDE